MRGAILVLIIGILLPWALRRPEVGVYLWTWLSVMNPHKLTYGFAFNMPFAYAAALVTFVGFAFSKNKHGLPRDRGTVLFVLLTIWMTVTSFFAIAGRDLVLERWVFVMKINVMMLLTLMIIRGRKQIDALIWVVVLSVGFFGFKGGLYAIATGGSGRVWGPPGMIEGNNELAVALVLLVPWMYYLFHSAKVRWVRWGMGATMVLSGLAVLGSQSRGALLALLAMATLLGLKSRYPVRVTLLIVTLATAGIAFMPDSWNKRMNTIGTYEQDTSAMSRLFVWQTLWNAAVDRPLVGAGFRADNPETFRRYAPKDSGFVAIGGSQDVIYVAHSIYFQALGEHGFPGLLLYLGLGIWVWRAASRRAKEAIRTPEFAEWVPLLMRMTQVGLVGFAVGGSFLSLMNLDIPFYLFAVVSLVGATMDGESKQKQVISGPTIARTPART